MGVALESKTGASAPPPFFGLRHFPVELAGLRGVFVARLRRGNYSVCTSRSFFWPPPEPEPSRSSANGHQRAPFCLKVTPCVAKFLGLPPQTPLGSLVCPSLFRALPPPTDCAAPCVRSATLVAPFFNKKSAARSSNLVHQSLWSRVQLKTKPSSVQADDFVLRTTLFFSNS